MKGLIAVLVLVVAVVVALGFYRGWWSLASDSTDSKVHLNVTVDKDKLQEDKTSAMEKVQGLGHEVKEKATAPTAESKHEAAPPVPSTQNQR